MTRDLRLHILIVDLLVGDKVTVILEKACDCGWAGNFSSRSRTLEHSLMQEYRFTSSASKSL